MTYPGNVIVGEEASIAGNRLLLIDPRGEIDENELLEFMEKHVESAFWEWWKQKEASRHVSETGGIKAMQLERPTAKEIQPMQVQEVAPGPQVYLVNCWHCNGQISWQLDLGVTGSCPYCRAMLRLNI